eukprot:4604165-Prorocentrum_lima.AAC.1
MRRHGIAALDEVFAMKQNMAQAEREKQRMIAFAEQAETKTAEEDRLRQQTITEAQEFFRKQEQHIQREKEQS